MAGRLEGKVALITGAGSVGPGWGNGKATAALFAREGAKLVGCDINPAAVEETAEIVAAEGGTFLPVTCDVSDKSQVDTMIGRAVEAFGRIDILHNNVGIAVVGGLQDVEEEEWDRVDRINLKSAYLVSRAAIGPMLESGGGSIIHTASIAATRFTGINYITYSTTKGALVPFSRSIALEYARQGIRSNCILPGLMDTPMIRVGLPAAYADGDSDEMVRKRNEQCPTGRMGDAWDVAYAALFLASDESKYVTATELVVDGGITAKIA